MTKLTTDRIPNMKPKEKSKKLGILTPKRRKNITMRFQHDTIERLEKILHRAHEAINYKISRTDIIEALLFDAEENRHNTNIKTILLAFGKGE